MAEFPTPKDIQAFQLRQSGSQQQGQSLQNLNVIQGPSSVGVPGPSPQQLFHAVNSNHQRPVIMDFKSVDEYSTEGLKRIIEATKAFQMLPPAGPMWDLQKSYPEFTRAMKNCRTRIVPMLKTLLQHAKISTNDFKKRDLEEKFDFIVDANDDILERIATALDEASGVLKRTEALAVNQNKIQINNNEATNWNKRKTATDQRDSIAIANYNSIKKTNIFADAIKSKESSRPSAIIVNGVPGEIPELSKITGGGDRKERPILKALHRLRVTEKPQIHFKVPVDNSLGPFIPKLKDKPNSIKPLSILPEYNSKNEEFYGHPYNVELNRWEADDKFMIEVEPKLPVPPSQMPFKYVASKEELDEMMKELREVDEIAVDLEHHAYRTFLGLTCTVQISTRQSDYVIDALALREELEVLNEVFTKPKVMKVFHGAQSDIEWLQRDFGVYVVGLFDTHIAAKNLGFPVLSLQYLLQRFCKINVDKTYQLADWRLRPLPIDMIEYCRQDTHYLLYLYDVLKNELIKNGNQFKNLLTAVYDRSRMICLTRYEKPSNNPQLAIRKTRRQLNNRQLYAFTELYKWRDSLAREKDESLGFILPNHMLLMIAESLPKEMTGILACCDPVPPMVQHNLGELHRIILQARDLPLHEEKVQLGTVGKVRKKQKSWVIMLNSVLDVNLDELQNQQQPPEEDDAGDIDIDDTNTTERPTSTTTITRPRLSPSKTSWPEAWDPNSVDISNIKIKAQPSSKMFGLRLDGISEARYQNRPPSNAFQRYQLSNEIVQMLKDPKKKEELDLEDPLVRVVYDTLIADTESLNMNEEKSDDESRRERQLHKVLPDSEFVPFNPMAEKLRSMEPPSKKKKTKKTREEWDDGKPYETRDHIPKDFVGNPIQNDDQTEDPHDRSGAKGDDDEICEVLDEEDANDDEDEDEPIDEEELFREVSSEPQQKMSSRKKRREKMLERLKLKKLMKLKRKKKYELAALEKEEREKKKGNRSGSPEIIEIVEVRKSKSRSKSPTPSTRRNKRARRDDPNNDGGDDEVICLDDDAPSASKSPPRRRRQKDKERERVNTRNSNKVPNPCAIAAPPSEASDKYAGFMQMGKVRADSTFSHVGLATVRRRATRVNGNEGSGSGGAVSSTSSSVHVNPRFLPGASVPVPVPPPVVPAQPPTRFLNQFRRVDGKCMSFTR